MAGFFVVVAFGVGVIATAAYNTNNRGGAADASPVAASAEVQEIDVELGELYVKPASLRAEAGALRINVHNAGGAEHNFSLGSLGKTRMLGAGESAMLEIPNVAPGKYEFVCEVSGHADGGMKGTLTVGAAGAKDAESHEGMAGMSPQEMVEHDAAVTAQFPAKTKGTGGTLLEPEIAADGTKVYELTADEIEWETEPGVVQEAWAYNGMVPGPTLKPELGDRVKIVLRNELDEPTTMHFHGMTLPADMDGVPVVSQDAVMPGESFAYEFTIRNSGSNMYHSHFNAQKQVPMGLLGAMIVPDPKDPAVNADVNMIVNDGPLGYTINGKGFPATAPIVAAKGDTIRIRYMNEGLQIHPMHLHGMPQKVIAIDGHLLKQPYDLDTVLVAPGQRIDVLVKATEAGTWAFHCHVLNHAEGPNGMFGMVTAMVVQ
ncbi:MAG TPA: multicopper oxidase domain-containing protein [Actinomycetota bacterium]|nr:multicopper oxidase domain-containing protein [Actinomycetota bacterium]